MSFLQVVLRIRTSHRYGTQVHSVFTRCSLSVYSPFILFTHLDIILDTKWSLRGLYLCYNDVYYNAVVVVEEIGITILGGVPVRTLIQKLKKFLGILYLSFTKLYGIYQLLENYIKLYNIRIG